MASGAGNLFEPPGLRNSHRTLCLVPEQVWGLWGKIKD
jgi:hypothetical protein